LSYLKVFYVFQHERWCIRRLGSLDAEEVGSMDVVENKRRPGIRLLHENLYIIHLDAFYMSNEKPVGRRIPEPPRFGIPVALLFRGLKLGLFCGAAAAMFNQDVAELHVFNRMAGQAGAQRGDVRDRIRTDDITDDHAAKSPNRHTFRTAHSVAKTHKDRSVDYVAHADVVDCDVFEQRAIHGFEGDAVAAVQDAVRDRDAFETSVRFGSEFDAAIARHMGVCGKRFARAVEERAFHVTAGDEAVGDGQVFCRSRVAERKRTLGADGVVPWRIHAAVADTDIAAAIHVDAVAVGIDLEVVDRKVIDAGGEDSEVPAVQD